ncbi:MAG: protein kinase [Rubrivivax sp.]|nr:protein kinase [Rubrivivax sp.]
MTPAADDDKTAFTPRDSAKGGGFEPTHFAPTAPVERTEIMAPPPTKAAELGNVLPVGTRMKEFEITGLLGEGGFGIVYLAYDTSVHRRVALKEYMPTSLAARTESGIQVKSERHRETFEAGMKSFVNEARLLAQFDHASLVRVYQFWEANGTAYMVMPFYEGKNLRDTLREMVAANGGPPDEAWLRTLLLPLCEALRVIHAENCFHRDIAPDNVMMLAGSQRPLLLDFGAARRVIGDMTQALTVILKPGYAPIEQYAEIPGMRQGPWTDVYALAAVVYFAITGKTPPVSVGRMLSDSYQPLAQVAAGRYSAQFLEAVDRALLVRPEQRTQNIEAFRDDLGLLHPSTGMGGARTVMSGQADDVTRIAPPTMTRQPGAPGAGTQVRGPGPQTLMAQQPPTFAAPPPQPPTRMAPAAPEAGEPTRMAPRRAPPPTAAPQRDARSAEGEGSSRRGLVFGVAGAAVVALGTGGYLMTRPKTDGSISPPPPVPGPGAGPAPTPAPAPAVAQPAPPAPVAVAFSAVREFDKVVQAQAAGFGVRASAPKTTLRIGADRFRFNVQSDRAGHLYVLAVGPDGALAQIVPNRLSGPVTVRAGQNWQFPIKGGLELDAVEPAGPNHFLVIVSAEARNFDGLRPQAEGDIRIFAGGEAAAAAVASHAGPGSVVAGRASCAPGGAACDGSYGAAVLKIDAIR